MTTPPLRKIVFWLVSLLTLITATTTAVAADDGRWAMGVRGTGLSAGGTPANDMMSVGIFWRYALSPSSALGFAIDRAKHDFETPASVLGLSQDPAVKPIDSIVNATAISLWYEQLLGASGGPSRWFATAGLGVARPEIDDASGTLAGGGSFDITTDAGTEIIASLSAGWRRRLGENWSAEVALRADHHFAEWEVRDRVSGRTGTIDDYTGWGAHLGLSYRF